MVRLLVLAAALAALLIGWLLWDGAGVAVRRDRSGVVAERESAGDARNPDRPRAGDQRDAGFSERSHVLQGEDGRPIEGAVIDVWTVDGWVPAGRTGPDGRVEWTRPVDANDRFRIRHPRLQIWQPHGWNPGEPLQVPAGLPLSVRVRGPSGKAVESAEVILDCVHFWRDKDQRQNRDELGGQVGRTDAEGLAIFAGLPVGGIELDVQVVHERYVVFSEAWEFDERVDPILDVSLEEGGTIAGRVIDPHGNGVSDAVVSLGLKQVSTGANGSYEMLGAAQRGFLVAHKPGVGIGNRVATAIEPEERLDGADITIWPASRISGAVRSSAGDPIVAPRFKIGAYIPWIPKGMDERLELDGTFCTDEFFVLKPSVILITVESDSHISARVAADVRPGQQTDVGEIRLLSMGSLAGRVVTASGDSVGGGYVEVANVRALIDENGRFEAVGIPAGTWAVARYQGRTQPEGVSDPIVMEPGRRVEDVRIVVGEPGVIRGVVKDQDGVPYPGVQVAAIPPGMPPQIDVRKWGSFQTDAEGYFRIDGLAPARYRVAVVHTGDVVLTGFPIDGRMEPVEVDLSDGTADVELLVQRRGTVALTVEAASGRSLGTTALTLARLESPVPTVAGRYWSRSESRTSWRGAPSPLSTELEFERPGLYVLVIDSPRHARWQSKVMEISGASRIDLGIVKLSEGRRVTLRVQTADGGPAEGARVQGFDRKEQAASARALWTTDETGRAVLDHVPEGDFVLLIEHPDAAPAALRLPSSGSATLDVALTAGREVIRTFVGASAPVLLFDRSQGLFLGRAQTDAEGILRLPRAPQSAFRIVVTGSDGAPVQILDVE